MKVDIMASDLNMVEDQIDRLPARFNLEDSVTALDLLKATLHVCDMWRDTFPTKKMFSFIQEVTKTMSRLDRIYMSDVISISAQDWNISPTGVPGTDHHLTSVQVAHLDAPLIGRGRWTLKKHIIRDKKFRSFVTSSGVRAIEEVESSMHT